MKLVQKQRERINSRNQTTAPTLDLTLESKEMQSRQLGFALRCGTPEEKV